LAKWQLSKAQWNFHGSAACRRGCRVGASGKPKSHSSGSGSADCFLRNKKCAEVCRSKFAEYVAIQFGVRISRTNHFDNCFSNSELDFFSRKVHSVEWLNDFEFSIEWFGSNRQSVVVDCNGK
jgi:hypothetical protein